MPEIFQMLASTMFTWIHLLSKQGFKRLRHDFRHSLVRMWKCGLYIIKLCWNVEFDFLWCTHLVALIHETLIQQKPAYAHFHAKAIYQFKHELEWAIFTLKSTSSQVYILLKVKGFQRMQHNAAFLSKNWEVMSYIYEILHTLDKTTLHIYRLP